MERLSGELRTSVSSAEKIASHGSGGTPLAGVPTDPQVSAAGPVRSASDGEARRGRRASIGENFHGPQLDGGLAILAEGIQNICSLPT
ncbi:hypothetical protein PC121_g6041 [Phytophthora cactorum]|nr:hypothetical protein PC120_g3374 [Phytophthora cactorum]KAG3082569.1 hypothetical protein PC121_g6041 [Phytophthora cactorum]KAG4061431.1 hypothetical protein PC123_g3694 [Phytophthora cactorum]